MAEWTFEPDPLPQDKRGSSAGPFKPAVGSGSFSGVHKSEDSKWSSPAGNGSTNSLNVDGWAPGDAFVMKVSTTGRRNIVLSWDQTRSESGPPDFVLCCRLPGGAAKELVAYKVPVVRWSVSKPSDSNSFVADLTGAGEVNDKAQIEFMIVAKAGGTAPNGTTRIDNIRVWGVPYAGETPGQSQR